MPTEQVGSLGSQVHRVLVEGRATWGQDPISLGPAHSSLSRHAPQQVLLLVAPCLQLEASRHLTTLLYQLQCLGPVHTKPEGQTVYLIHSNPLSRVPHKPFAPSQAPSILKEASRSWAAQEVLHSESKGSGPKSGRPSGVWLWQDHIRGSLPVLRASSPLTGTWARQRLTHPGFPPGYRETVPFFRKQ